MALSDIQKEYGRILHKRGRSQSYIAKELGITQSRVSKIAKGEGWKEDVLPKFTRGDLVDNAEEILFRYQVAILRGHEEDNTRAALNQHKFSSALKDIEETYLAVSLRGQIESLKLFATHAAEDGRADVAEYLQGLYDAKVKEL